MAERIKRRRNVMKNSQAKAVIPRIENLLAEEDKNSEEYQSELSFSGTT